MTIITIKTGHTVPSQDYHTFKAGDYVLSVDRPRTTHELLKVRGYDTFGQVMVHFVRHEHRKYVPWHLEHERGLVDAASLGIEVPS